MPKHSLAEKSSLYTQLWYSWFMFVDSCRLWSANWPQWVLCEGDTKAQPKCFLSLPRLSHQPVCPEVCFCQKHLHSQSITVGWRGPAASGLLTVRHVWGAKMWNGKWYSVTCLGFLCVKQPKCSYSHRSSGHTKGNLLLLSSGNALKWYSLSWG